MYLVLIHEVRGDSFEICHQIMKRQPDKFFQKGAQWLATSTEALDSSFIEARFRVCPALFQGRRCLYGSSIEDIKIRFLVAWKGYIYKKVLQQDTECDKDVQWICERRCAFLLPL